MLIYPTKKGPQSLPFCGPYIRGGVYWVIKLLATFGHG